MELAIKAQEQAEKNEKYQVAIIGTNIEQNILKIFKKYLRDLMFTHYIGLTREAIDKILQSILRQKFL